ncbi:mucin-3A-like isoform X3 [Homarus americanus]|uniref:mucin-3A-like isoform X3 n=1 Tax=Homarus americanus TaxID=6706 RepID=UPI001C493618|nr:mucin-3A-like isoform X3 [Homarus americanus]
MGGATVAAISCMTILLLLGSWVEGEEDLPSDDVLQAVKLLQGASGQRRSVTRGREGSSDVEEEEDSLIQNVLQDFAKIRDTGDDRERPQSAKPSMPPQSTLRVLDVRVDASSNSIPMEKLVGADTSRNLRRQTASSSFSQRTGVAPGEEEQISTTFKKGRLGRVRVVTIKRPLGQVEAREEAHEDYDLSLFDPNNVYSFVDWGKRLDHHKTEDDTAASGSAKAKSTRTPQRRPTTLAPATLAAIPGAVTPSTPGGTSRPRFTPTRQRGTNNKISVASTTRPRVPARDRSGFTTRPHFKSVPRTRVTQQVTPTAVRTRPRVTSDKSRGTSTATSTTNSAEKFGDEDDDVPFNALEDIPRVSSKISDEYPDYDNDSQPPRAPTGLLRPRLTQQGSPRPTQSRLLTPVTSNFLRPRPVTFPFTSVAPLTPSSPSLVNSPSPAPPRVPVRGVTTPSNSPFSSSFSTFSFNRLPDTQSTHAPASVSPTHSGTSFFTSPRPPVTSSFSPLRITSPGPFPFTSPRSSFFNSPRPAQFPSSTSVSLESPNTASFTTPSTPLFTTPSPLLFNNPSLTGFTPSDPSQFTSSPSRPTSATPTQFGFRHSQFPSPNPVQFSSPVPFQVTSLSPTQFSSLPSQSTSPRSFQSTSPRSFQSTSPRSFQSTSPRSFQSTSPRSFQSTSPRSFQSTSPPSFQSTSPRSFQPTSQQSFQSTSPRPFQITSPSPNQFSSPGPSRFSTSRPTLFTNSHSPFLDPVTTPHPSFVSSSAPTFLPSSRPGGQPFTNINTQKPPHTGFSLESFNPGSPFFNSLKLGVPSQSVERNQGSHRSTNSQEVDRQRGRSQTSKALVSPPGQVFSTRRPPQVVPSPPPPTLPPLPILSRPSSSSPSQRGFSSSPAVFSRPTLPRFSTTPTPSSSPFTPSHTTFNFRPLSSTTTTFPPSFASITTNPTSQSSVSPTHFTVNRNNNNIQGARGQPNEPRPTTFSPPRRVVPGNTFQFLMHHNDHNTDILRNGVTSTPQPTTTLTSPPFFRFFSTTRATRTPSTLRAISQPTQPVTSTEPPGVNSFQSFRVPVPITSSSLPSTQPNPNTFQNTFQSSRISSTPKTLASVRASPPSTTFQNSVNRGTSDPRQSIGNNFVGHVTNSPTLTPLPPRTTTTSPFFAAFGRLQTSAPGDKFTNTFDGGNTQTNTFRSSNPENSTLNAGNVHKVAFNTGNSQTGTFNTGNSQTGTFNTGNSQTSNLNTGNSQTGNFNTGNSQTSNFNTGNSQTSTFITGNSKTGTFITGNSRTNKFNSGNSQTSNFNTGNSQTGNFNTGNSRTNKFNSGNSQTSNFNTGNSQTNKFNSGNSQTRNFNTGNAQTSNFNTGNSQTNKFNSGNSQTGNFNTGNSQTNKFNSGNSQTSNFNTGNSQTRTFTTGNSQTGNFNTGNPQTNEFNSGNSQTRNFNTGNSQTNKFNSGNSQTSNFNTGNAQTSNFNTGNSQTNKFNSVNSQTSNFNTGNSQTNKFNSGNSKTSKFDTGNSQTNKFNSGNSQSSNFNTGNSQTNKFNSGNSQTRNFNTGSSQTNKFNSGNSQTSNFNTGNSQTNKFNSGNSQTRNFNTGNSQTPTFITGDIQSSTFKAGNAQNSNLNTGDVQTIVKIDNNQSSNRGSNTHSNADRGDNIQSSNANRGGNLQNSNANTNRGLTVNRGSVRFSTTNRGLPENSDPNNVQFSSNNIVQIKSINSDNVQNINGNRNNIQTGIRNNVNVVNVGVTNVEGGREGGERRGPFRELPSPPVIIHGGFVPMTPPTTTTTTTARPANPSFSLTPPTASAFGLRAAPPILATTLTPSLPRPTTPRRHIFKASTTRLTTTPAPDTFRPTTTTPPRVTTFRGPFPSQTFTTSSPLSTTRLYNFVNNISPVRRQSSSFTTTPSPNTRPQTTLKSITRGPSTSRFNFSPSTTPRPVSSQRVVTTRSPPVTSPKPNRVLSSTIQPQFKSVRATRQPSRTPSFSVNNVAKQLLKPFTTSRPSPGGKTSSISQAGQTNNSETIPRSFQPLAPISGKSFIFVRNGNNEYRVVWD